MIDINKLEEALKRVNWYLETYYRITIGQVEITDTPGYWRSKKPSFNYSLTEKPFYCTYSFYDTDLYLYNSGRDKRGRFISPYTTWRIIKEATPIKVSRYLRELDLD